MKTKNIITWITVTLLAAGTALAQGGPGRRGGGNGTPPKTEEERAVRQAERKQANPDNRGNRAGQRQPRGRGNGNCDGTGQGQGNGPRDGSGPRGGTIDCPASN